jgi:hypothetical protein
MNKTPEFKEISEIVSNPYFVDFLTKNLSDLKAQRKLRPLPPTGFNYKKDWMDKMDVSVDYFISNIEAIWLKKSKLNRSEREIIGYLCDKSFIQTLAKYKELESNQIGLSSEITYTKETPDSYDGEKPNMMFDDEEGMTASADVVKKWDIIKNNGLEITGMPMIEQDFTEVGNYVKNMITEKNELESAKIHIPKTTPDRYDGEKQHFIHDDEMGNTSVGVCKKEKKPEFTYKGIDVYKNKNNGAFYRINIDGKDYFCDSNQACFDGIDEILKQTKTKEDATKV